MRWSTTCNALISGAWHQSLMLANWLNITCPILCNKNSYKYRLQDQPQLKLCKCSLQLDWSLSRKLLFEFRTDYKSLFSTAWIKRPRSWPPSMDASKIPTKKLGYMFSNVVQNRIVQWHVLLACWREWFEGCYKSFSSYLYLPDVLCESSLMIWPILLHNHNQSTFKRVLQNLNLTRHSTRM